MDSASPSLIESYARVCAQVAMATHDSGRDAHAVTLVAVTKTRDSSAIGALLHAGQRCFAENRVQESARKYPRLRPQWPEVELHLIGALQTNKARFAVQIFQVISTLDRPALAHTLARLRDQGLSLPRLRIEVNIGHEPQKSGVLPEDFPEFLALCRDALKLPIEGVMAIPPHGLPPRPFFQDMRALAMRYDLPVLSIGMSEDFREAIACGSTEVRIGRGLFAPVRSNPEEFPESPP